MFARDGPEFKGTEQDDYLKIFSDTKRSNRSRFLLFLSWPESPHSRLRATVLGSRSRVWKGLRVVPFFIMVAGLSLVVWSSFFPSLFLNLTEPDPRENNGRGNLIFK